MSKAFTKESDTQDDDEVGLPPLPAGGKNYITPQGYAVLRAELFELIDNERPRIVEIVHWAAAMVTVQKTVTTCMAKNVCAKSIDAFGF